MYEMVQVTAELGLVLPPVPPVVTHAIERAVPKVTPGAAPVRKGTVTTLDAGTKMTVSAAVVPKVTEPLARLNIFK